MIQALMIGGCIVLLLANEIRLEIKIRKLKKMKNAERKQELEWQKEQLQACLLETNKPSDQEEINNLLTKVELELSTIK